MSEASAVLAARDYADFRQRLAASNCSLCPELCRDRHNIVVDRGNPSARLLVVGEAPGENEDLEGRAFIGRGGRLLDRLMAGAGIDLNRDALIVNVVKCRPPKNRPPTPQEAANCRPYLEWQIRAVQPAVVVLLGATAAKHLLPPVKNTPMRDRVGRITVSPTLPGVSVQILFHPAYLLRDPRKMPEAERHVATLKAHLIERGLM